MQDVVTVATTLGEGRITIAAADQPRAVLLLGHGAGGGIDAFDLVTLAERLPPLGIAVARYEQPWRVAGKRIAGSPASLDSAWPPAQDAVEARFPRVARFEGGRSAGARVACRCFGTPALGVVALSFPLHPPGKPERSRIEELAAVAGPVLIVQGERDPFGSPDEVRAACAGLPQAGERSVVGIPGAAHSFAPRSKAAQSDAPGVAGQIADAVRGFVDGVLARLPR